MKHLLVLAALTTALFSASCNKCVTCSYTFTYNGKDSTVNRPEVCGNPTEITNEENTTKAVSARAGALDFTCTKK
jgi:hypothetical protein